MAHRRKSSHPVYRTRKTETSECHEDEELYDVKDLRKSDEQMTAETHSSSEKHLDIPQDLFKDFEVLRNVTKLETAELMRKLLKDYHSSRTDEPSSLKPPGNIKGNSFCVSPTVLPVDQQAIDSPVSLLGSHYNAHLSEQRQSPANRAHNFHPTRAPQNVFEEREPGEITRHYYNPDANSPLDLSVMKAEKALEDQPVAFDMKWKYLQEPASIAKDEIPDLNSTNMLITGNQLPATTNVIPIQPNQGCMYVYPVGFAPQAPGQVGMVGAPAVVGTAITPNDPTQVAMVSQILPQSIAASTEPARPLPVAPPMTTKMSKSPRGGHRRGSAANTKNQNQGKMKLLTENTLFPGVYTSILKLPWSRRSRSSKHSISSHPDQDSNGNGMKLPVSQPSLGGDQALGSNPPMPLSHIEGQQSVTTSCQSLMMVYPHATTTSMGKPVRKRGRPPKLPMLAKLLAESNKKSKLEIQVANQNPFQMVQPPVGIVMGNGTTIGGVPVLPQQGEIPAAASMGVDNSIPPVPVPINAPILIAPTPVPNQNLAPVNTFQQQPIPDVKQEPNHSKVPITNQSVQNIAPAPSPGINSVTSTELPVSQGITSTYTMTTTTMTSTASGALYQEMILSSKSLVNVRPRKRQTTNELLKSKSSSSQNFICTSFRIRPRLSSSGSSQKVEEMVRFVRNRRKKNSGYKHAQVEPEQTEISPSTLHEQSFSQQKLSCYLKKRKSAEDISDIEDGLNDHSEMDMNIDPQKPEINYEADNNFDKSNYETGTQELINSPEYENERQENLDQNGCCDIDENSNQSDNNMTFSDDNDLDLDREESTQSMFQELYHCRVCNEIISMDEKFEHMGTHVRMEMTCKSCGEDFQCYLNKDVENNSKSQLYLCDTCSQTSDVNFKKVLPRQSQGIMCDDCGLHFKKFSAYYKHRAAVHTQKFANTPSDDHFCQKCGKFFVSSKGLCYHMKIHEKKTIPCPVADCPRLFSKKTQLNSHIRDHHDKQKQFSCIYDGCSKKFMKNFHLQEHIRVKHFNIRAYKCSWTDCGKEFAAERHLKVHLLIHKDEKPMKCEYCDYRCRQRNAMNWHMRKHPEVPYKYRKYVTVGTNGSGQDSE